MRRSHEEHQAKIRINLCTVPSGIERKCRFLFGGGVVVLIWLSLWLYAYQTEHLAYDQAADDCLHPNRKCMDSLTKIVANRSSIVWVLEECFQPLQHR